MKKLLSILSAIMALCILLSCTAVTGVTAAAPDQEPVPGYNYYCQGVASLATTRMPKIVKAQFDYDRDFIDIVPDYPGYEDKGFIFPLATAAYGNMYDVSYTVDDTVITYTYTLKSGYTFDDYLSMLDEIRAAQEMPPESREEGAFHSVIMFEIAMKKKVEVMAQIYESKLLDIVLDDGTVLYRDGEKLGDGGSQCILFPLRDPDVPVETTPAKEYKYRSKLLSQYQFYGSQLMGYDELYEHKDANGEVDWALVKGAKEGVVSDYWIHPAYYEFGNRVMINEYPNEPFAFGMGVYIAKYDRFFDVNAPELRELDGLDRVWTQMGAGRLMGDMDGNDCLEIIDAVMIQRCAARILNYPDDDVNSPGSRVVSPIGYFSDFDQDGKRSIMDASCIQRYLANLQYRPEGWTPYPHDPQASDPTEDLPFEPDPTECEPTQPSPTQPSPTQPSPTEPAPTESDDPIPRITGFRSIGKGVEIQLSRVKGAEKYRVYYWSKAKNDWKSMGETATNVFVDDDVAIGSTYLYTVRCVNGAGKYTSDFDHDGWTYTYDPQLDTPQITRIEATDSGAKITWAEVDGADLYRVYRHDGDEGWTKLTDTRDTSYTDAGVRRGESTGYTVRCLSCRGKGFASSYTGVSFFFFDNPVIENMETHLDGVSFTVKTGIKYLNYPIAVYRKEASGWKRIGVTTPNTRFTDTDAEPEKTYTYTARCLNKDGTCFASMYNTTGWTRKFSLYNVVPELEFFIFSGDDTVLLQIKDGNKFDVPHFVLELYKYHDEYVGSIVWSGNDPVYVQSELFKANSSFQAYLYLLDEDENVIASCDEEIQLILLLAPKELKAKSLGDRRYQFHWTSGYSIVPYGYYFNLVAEDGTVIDSGLIEDGHSWYTVDLSEYPEDMQWTCLVWATNYWETSMSAPLSMEFKESDYQ